VLNISPTVAEEVLERFLQMAHTVPVIGIDPAELAWIRMLVLLLRHPDPVVPELTRQALRYLEAAASRSGVSRTGREAAPAIQR
jgi:hypothetical protein